MPASRWRSEMSRDSRLCVRWIITCLVVTGARSAASDYRQSTTPAPPGSGYSFAFAVRDEPTYKDHSHQETSDGHVVRGSYRVALPDGRVQVVNYRADRNGYVADVTYEGDINYPPASAYAKHPAPLHSARANVAAQYANQVHLPEKAAESQVAKIGTVEDHSTAKAENVGQTVQEPVQEPVVRIRPIKLTPPKEGHVVTPGPISRIRPIKLTHSKAGETPEATAKIRPIKLSAPKVGDEVVPAESNRSKPIFPKLALKRPFPKPVVEQTARPKAVDGILKPIYPRPLLPKANLTLALPKASYPRPALPKTSAQPLGLKKLLYPKPQTGHLKPVYPKISNKSTVLRWPSLNFPKPSLYTTTTTTTEAPTTASVAIESETVDPVTDSATDAPVTESRAEESAPVTESATEIPQTIGELLAATAVVAESVTESTDDSVTELAESADATTTETPVTETSEAETTEAGAALYVPVSTA